MGLILQGCFDFGFNIDTRSTAYFCIEIDMLVRTLQCCIFRFNIKAELTASFCIDMLVEVFQCCIIRFDIVAESTAYARKGILILTASLLPLKFEVAMCLQVLQLKQLFFSTLLSVSTHSFIDTVYRFQQRV